MTAAVFHLNTVQCVNIDSLTDDIIFETRYVKTNTSYYFTLSQEQFHAFDDALCVIDRGNMQGYFPLGGDVYFNYHRGHEGDESQFIKFGRKDRLDIKFDFIVFNDYMKYVHHRILSFLRLPDGETRRRGRKRHRETKDRGNSSVGKCPLPDVCKSAIKSSTSGKVCEGEITPRSTDNALMSTSDEACAVLPQRGSPNLGRFDNSSIAEDTFPNDLPSPQPVQLLDDESCDGMEVY